MIAAADLHLRLTTPQARVDDYRAAQARKFRFILDLARKSPPLVVAGDFFDLAQQPKGGEELLEWVIAMLREYEVVPIVTPGQHDLPSHSLEQIRKSSLGVLAAAGVIILLPGHYDIPVLQEPNVIWGRSWGQSPDNIDTTGYNYHTKILIWHHMVINELLWPGQIADKANSILGKYPQFDYIVTGDNHQTFITADTSKIPVINHPNKPWQQTGLTAPYTPVKNKTRCLINPGSMMRMTIAQVNHKPCVFRIEDGRVEQIFLPIEPDVLDLSENIQAKERDSRMEAFVERLDGNMEFGLDFRENMRRYLEANPEDVETEKLIWEFME